MKRLLLLGVALTAVTFGAAVTSLAGGGDDRPRSAATRTTTADRIGVLEQTVRDRPRDAATSAELAGLYLQRARETGDPWFYGLAQVASDRALAEAPDDPHTLVAAAGVALAKHDFAQALAIGERARALHPDVVAVYGVLADAATELGRYDDALVYAQEMLDRRPGFASYSRVSYLRELHGDIAGAIEAMTLAAAAAPTPFDEAWARVITGELYLAVNDLDAADAELMRAEAVLPGDAMVLDSRAHVDIAFGDLVRAETLLREAIAAKPVSDYMQALGDLLASQGRDAEAFDLYVGAREAEERFAAAGGDASVDLALFEADFGDPESAYAQASAAYARRPNIHAADTLAWAAFRSGRLDEAQARIAEALRLGTRDAGILAHAEAINAAVRVE